MAFALRIGSRPSRLAIAQATSVKNHLEAALPGLKAELVAVSTSGDRLLSGSLASFGGKGLFIKELEQALAARRIDIAVHSMKDLPATLAAGYRLLAVPRREDPRDALISVTGARLYELAGGARLGTSSPRRKFEALRLRPDLNVLPLRGNVDTRLRRLAGGELDAIVLAMAGLKRLGGADLSNLEELDERDFVPAAGQGALALETMADSPLGGSAELEAAGAALTDRAAFAETSAERAFLAALGASCVSPVGVKGTLTGDDFTMRALLFSLDGSHSLSETIAETTIGGDDGRFAALGRELGRRMLARGAGELLGRG